MPDFDDEDETDDLGVDEDPDPSDQDSTDEDGDEVGEQCPHCGKYIFEEAAVCPHCLSPIDMSVHNWRHGKKWFIAGLVTVVIIIGLFFWYLSRGTLLL
jgi:hypothetical protein